MCTCVCVWVYAHEHRYAWKSEEGVRPSGAVVTGSVSNQISESCFHPGQRLSSMCMHNTLVCFLLLEETP